MACLILRKNQEEIVYNLYKRLTSIGRNGDIKIDIISNEDIIAYIKSDEKQYTLISSKNSLPICIDNRPVNNHILKNNDSFYIEEFNFIFKEKHEIKKNNIEEKLTAYKRLVDFSLRISKEKDIDALLKTLLKEITDIINAEYGFLVLLEDGEPKIKVEQYADAQKLSDHISDSIVKKVLNNKEPIIISDALNDEEFKTSHSVINFRLSSVICAPLIYQGKLLGAIYVGNNSFINAFDHESLEIMTIYASQAAILVENALHINALKKQTKNLLDRLDLTKFGQIIGSCPSMQEVFCEITKIASTDISVLICGETGTGKELIARELHNRSLRKDGPFVHINCKAIPESLLESELFGHVRGAFSQAFQTKIGKFQSAYKGTLFLDEVSEIPYHLQIKILDALKEQKVCKIGDNNSDDINIRVVAATDKDLSSLIKENLFREDLYYKLNVVQINVPPLRERGNDVYVLANYFLQKFAQIYGKNIQGLDESAKSAILNYDWPGNVRQLENRLKRAIVMCENLRISKDDLDIKDILEKNSMSLTDAIDRFRKRYINEALERNDNNRTKTAQELGVDPRTIFRHLESKKKAIGSFDV